MYQCLERVRRRSHTVVFFVWLLAATSPFIVADLSVKTYVLSASIWGLTTPLRYMAQVWAAVLFDPMFHTLTLRRGTRLTLQKWRTHWQNMVIVTLESVAFMPRCAWVEFRTLHCTSAQPA
jgi:hypothetical protein